MAYNTTVSKGAQFQSLDRKKLSQLKNKDPLMELKCRVCSSTKIIPEVGIVDQGQYSDGQLKVVVSGNPNALFFRDDESSILKANICGECGHTELKASDPQALFQKYQTFLKSGQR